MLFTFDHFSYLSYLVIFYLVLPHPVRSIQRILKYPPTWTLSGDERQLLWKFRFSLMSEKRALTKFLRCVEWSDIQVRTSTLVILVCQYEDIIIAQSSMLWRYVGLLRKISFSIKKWILSWPRRDSFGLFLKGKLFLSLILCITWTLKQLLPSHSLF